MGYIITEFPVNKFSNLFKGTEAPVWVNVHGNQLCPTEAPGRDYTEKHLGIPLGHWSGYRSHRGGQDGHVRG